MYLELHGAADGVTGSLHRVHVGGRDVALDCGLFQGHRAETTRLNREPPDWATRAECVVLSHAHLDHSGRIPTLVKRGFRGNVFSTPATRDLCSVMLRDSAMIQEQDARYLNKRALREGSSERVEPLYTVEDAEHAVGQMVSLPLERPLKVAPGVTLTFYEAGHVLGSALVCLDLVEEGRARRLVFTGDLGREELPLLRAPKPVPGAHTLLMESTYGDRIHPALRAMDDRLAAIVTETVKRGGRVLIPAFALERSQELLYALGRLSEEHRIPRVPILVDSPLAIAVTEIYKLHPDALDPELRDQLGTRADPFAPPGLRYVSDVATSTALQQDGAPCIVVAGSGMCEGGRILHHLAHGLGDPRNSVVIVGFMAQHTLGRRLAEGRRRVRVFGVEREVQARVHVLEGLSAHADRDDLIAFARATAEAGPLRDIVLVHGEAHPKQALAEGLRTAGLGEVVVTIGEPGLRIAL